jgi:hypothetical protein
MIHPGANVRCHVCNLFAAIWFSSTVDEDSNRLIEFTYALDFSTQLQLSAESDLEKAIQDLSVGKFRSLQAASVADVWALCLYRPAGVGEQHHDCENKDCRQPPPRGCFDNRFLPSA